jgi:hypothetical protein
MALTSDDWDARPIAKATALSRVIVGPSQFCAGRETLTPVHR